MSNSPLVSATILSQNYHNRTHAIDTITIHCMAAQGSIETCGRSFQTGKWSSNYGIGPDGRIGLYVPEDKRSICTSSSSNDDRAITIEVASDNFHPYAITDKAYNALIDLLVDICQRNNIKKLLWKGDKNLIGQIDKQNMTVHRWFAAKACPGDYLYERHGDIAKEVNKRLENGGNDNMTQEQFNKMFETAIEKYRAELQDNDCGEYSKAGRDFMISNGYMQGSKAIDGKPNYMWQDFITREQLATILFRILGDK